MIAISRGVIVLIDEAAKPENPRITTKKIQCTGIASIILTTRLKIYNIIKERVSPSFLT